MTDKGMAITFLISMVIVTLVVYRAGRPLTFSQYIDNLDSFISNAKKIIGWCRGGNSTKQCQTMNTLIDDIARNVFSLNKNYFRFMRERNNRLELSEMQDLERVILRFENLFDVYLSRIQQADLETYKIQIEILEKVLVGTLEALYVARRIALAEMRVDTMPCEANPSVRTG